MFDQLSAPSSNQIHIKDDIFYNFWDFSQTDHRLLSDLSINEAANKHLTHKQLVVEDGHEAEMPIHMAINMQSALKGQGLTRSL